MWDLTSPTRDWTSNPCVARQILNHRTTREVPVSCLTIFRIVRTRHMESAKPQVGKDTAGWEVLGSWPCGVCCLTLAQRVGLSRSRFPRLQTWDTRCFYKGWCEKWVSPAHNKCFLRLSTVCPSPKLTAWLFMRWEPFCTTFFHFHSCIGRFSSFLLLPPKVHKRRSHHRPSVPSTSVQGRRTGTRSWIPSFVRDRSPLWTTTFISSSRSLLPQPDIWASCLAVFGSSLVC